LLLPFVASPTTRCTMSVECNRSSCRNLLFACLILNRQISSGTLDLSRDALSPVFLKQSNGCTLSQLRLSTGLISWELHARGPAQRYCAAQTIMHRSSPSSSVSLDLVCFL
jgi:hypothetical protein